jgi:excisionase family DNA binding protein
LCNIIEGVKTLARHKREEIQAEIPEDENATGKDLLTVREVARHLRVDDTTVRRWIKSGALDAVALPHSGKRCGYRVRKNTLDALFNTSSTAAV